MGAVCSILSMVSTGSRGGMPGLLVRQLLMGSVLGHRWVFARSRPTRTGAYCSPTFTWVVFRVLGGGRTWQPTIDINCDVHEVRAHPANPDMVAAAAAVGLCISCDSGATWIIEREG